jgi:hypothetical protein
MSPFDRAMFSQRMGATIAAYAGIWLESSKSAL